MANIESLHGSDKLREAYPKVNKNFNAIDKEVTDLRSRVNNIITTPIDGEAAAQEVVDARNSTAKSKIFDTLDARLEEIEQDNASVAQVLNEHKAENVSQAGGVHGLEIEEGTFTPYFYLGPEDTITYSQQTGKYMKVGNLVHLSIRLTLTSVNIISTGWNLRISGLPFVGVSVPVPASFVFSNLNIKSSGVIQGSIISTPEIVLQWVNTDGDGYLNMQLPDLKSNTDLRVSLTYKLD